MTEEAYCPHFKEVMDLGNCFFCFFKNKEQEEVSR